MKNTEQSVGHTRISKQISGPNITSSSVNNYSCADLVFQGGDFEGALGLRLVYIHTLIVISLKITK